MSTTVRGPAISRHRAKERVARDVLAFRIGTQVLIRIELEDGRKIWITVTDKKTMGRIARCARKAGGEE